MQIEIKIDIETRDDGSVIINEGELLERFYILTGRLQDKAIEFLPSRTKVKVEVYKGTERLHNACMPTAQKG